MKILFVCKGNVGRSQFAEALYKNKHPDANVISAGTNVFDKDGDSKDGQVLNEIPNIENVLIPVKELGMDISNKKRQQLTKEMIDWADKIIVIFEDTDSLPENLLNNHKVIRWSVPDPKGTTLEKHREIRDIIAELIDKNKF